MTTTIYVVRHGTTVWNVEKRYQGWADIPLDTFGNRQGELLVDYFKEIPIDLGVTSPLQRASKTLDYILDGRDVPILVEPGIMEIDQGDADGKTYEEILEICPDYAYTTRNKPGQSQAPNGENSQQVEKRMVNSVTKIARENQGKTIAMVSHGFAICMLVNYIMGNSLEQTRFLIPDNVAVTKIQVDDNGAMEMEYYNDSSHIPEELIFNYEHN